MTFDELFEKEEDDLLETLLKNSNDWCWGMYKDYDTDTFKRKARCYVNKDILFLLKNRFSLKESFYVKGIGLLRFNKTNHDDPMYYVELIEVED